MEVNKQHAMYGNFTLSFFRQAILNRSDDLFGSEFHAKAIKQNTYLKEGSALRSPPSQALHREVLMRIQLNNVQRAGVAATARPNTLVRQFVPVSHFSLLDNALIKEMNSIQATLQTHGQQLVPSIPAGLLRANIKENRSIISNIHVLKDNGVEIACDGYDLSDDGAQTLINLELFDYVKVDLTKSNFDIMVDHCQDFFNRSYDCLSNIIHHSKTKLIADRVEHKTLHTLARSMPFDFFQGRYYSPTEVI